MAVKIGHASISEKGTIRGVAGDQNGREVFTRKWYRHSKGWVTLRCKIPVMREYIARAMEKACANSDIGYDQIENQTLWNNVKSKGFDPSKTTKPVETDCARLVRVCCQYACVQVGNGKNIPDFYTANLASRLVSTGLFERLTSDKYNSQDAYLLRGDIQVTKTKGHTWVILENGSKTNVTTEPEKTYVLGERVLYNGDSGADVKELQEYLIQLGYDCGKWGADGEFGDSTEQAVEKFQREHNCDIDGHVGSETLKALQNALGDSDGESSNARYAIIVGGNCYVRTAPNTSGAKLGVAHAGDKFEYQGQDSEDGWHLIVYKNQNGWVSGKYSKLED